MSMSTIEAKIKSHSIPDKFELICVFNLHRLICIFNIKLNIPKVFYS